MTDTPLKNEWKDGLNWGGNNNVIRHWCQAHVKPKSYLKREKGESLN